MSRVVVSILSFLRAICSYLLKRSSYHAVPMSVVAVASAAAVVQVVVLAAWVCLLSTSLVLRIGNRGVRRVQSAPMWLSAAD